MLTPFHCAHTACFSLKQGMDNNASVFSELTVNSTYI